MSDRPGAGLQLREESLGPGPGVAVVVWDLGDGGP